MALPAVRCIEKFACSPLEVTQPPGGRRDEKPNYIVCHLPRIVAPSHSSLHDECVSQGTNSEHHVQNRRMEPRTSSLGEY